MSSAGAAPRRCSRSRYSVGVRRSSRSRARRPLRIDPGKPLVWSATPPNSSRASTLARRVSCRSTLARPTTSASSSTSRSARTRRRASPGNRPGRRPSPLAWRRAPTIRSSPRRRPARSRTFRRRFQPRWSPGASSRPTRNSSSRSSAWIGCCSTSAGGALSWTRRRRRPRRQTSVSMPSTSRSCSR